VSVIARYAIQSDALPLTETFSRGSIRLVLERTVGVDPSRPAHFSWVTDGATAFEAGTENDPTVRDVQCLTEKNGRRLYRYVVTDEAHTTYPKLVDIDAQRLHVQYAEGWWHARTRFPDAEIFTSYREWLADAGVTVRLLREYRSDAEGDSGLTPEQQAVVTLARERGYFAIPREAGRRGRAGGGASHLRGGATRAYPRTDDRTAGGARGGIPERLLRGAARDDDGRAGREARHLRAGGERAAPARLHPARGRDVRRRVTRKDGA